MSVRPVSPPLGFLLGSLAYFVARDVLPPLVVAVVTSKPMRRWL